MVDLPMNPNPNLPDDFWRYVDKSTDCWKWRGPMSGRKGTYKYQGRQQRVIRLICEDLPPNKNVDWNCNNTRCINPAHMFYIKGGVKPLPVEPHKEIEFRDIESLTVEEMSEITKEPKRRGFIKYLIEKYRIDYATIRKIRNN